MVYVLNQNGQPLMPTKRHGKVRRLLKNKEAVVVKRCPFTIQLLYETKEKTQTIILGVDTGSKTISLSASTKKEELFVAEVKPRNDIVKNLSTRREFRRSRRHRKRRYRKARFNNKVHSKHKGWLAPSVEVKIQEHITLIKRACELLPTSKVVVETAEFDLQRIKAEEQGLPVPKGTDYQKGEMMGHYNVRQYVLWRDGYTCQCCKVHGDGVKFHVHYLESRKMSGNAPDNLVTLCNDGHKKLHDEKLNLNALKKRKRRSTRDAAFMGIMRKSLMERLIIELDIPIVETKGYITKYTRTELLKMPKSHTNDALAIAQGPDGFGVDKPTSIERVDKVYQIRPVRHHNRQLHKATILRGGIRKNNQAPRYVRGFRLFDKVSYQGQECFVWGRRSSGAFLLKLLDGTRIKDGVNAKHLKLLERSTNYLIA